jgi:hypothetical protein
MGNRGNEPRGLVFSNRHVLLRDLATTECRVWSRNTGFVGLHPPRDALVSGKARTLGVPLLLLGQCSLRGLSGKHMLPRGPHCIEVLRQHNGIPCSGYIDTTNVKMFGVGDNFRWRMSGPPLL